MTAQVPKLVAEGRAALRRGDAAAGRAIFERAPTEPASGDVLEGLAHASYLERDYSQAIEEWERASLFAVTHGLMGELTIGFRESRSVVPPHWMTEPSHLPTQGRRRSLVRFRVIDPAMPRVGIRG